MQVYTSWPGLDKYQIAVQSPENFLRDPRLKKSSVERKGIFPCTRSGNFGTVYKFIEPNGKKWALKVFTKLIPQRQQRYTMLSEWLVNLKMRSMLWFEYQPEGILIDGTWYPALLMEWGNGETLMDYFKLQFEEKFQEVDNFTLTENWIRLMEDLSNASMAHGDLQHGNILLCPDKSFVLVDYDGMYVPSMKGEKALELGLTDYQHPQRDDSFFNNQLDDFSALVVLFQMMIINPGLWITFHQEDEYLIFQRSDIQDPDQSPLLKEMRKGTLSAKIKRAAEILTEACKGRIEDVPPFSFLVEEINRSRRVAQAVPSYQEKAKPKEPATSDVQAKPLSRPVAIGASSFCLLALILYFLLAPGKLSSSDWKVRIEGIEEAVQSNPAKAAPKIAGKLGDLEAEVRLAAVNALKKLGAKEYAEEIKLLLQDEEEKNRLAALETLIQFKESRFHNAFIGAMSDKSRDVKIRATQAIGLLKIEEGISSLKRALSHSDEKICLAAIESLSTFDKQETKESLKRMADTTKSEGIYMACVRALSKISAEGSVYHSILHLKEGDKAARIGAVKESGRLEASEALDLLGMALNDENSEVRMEALTMLSSMKNPKAVDKIVSALKDKSLDVRLMACRIIEAKKEREGALGLIAALKDESVQMKRAAANALAVVVPEKAELYGCIAMYHEENPEKTSAALKRMASLGSPEFHDYFVEALENLEVEVQLAAIEAVGQLKLQRVLPELKKMIRGISSHEHRVAIVKAIGKIEEQSALEILSGEGYWKKLPEWRAIQAAAVEAVGELRMSSVAEELLAIFSQTRDEEGIKLAAVRSLGKIRAKKAAVPLREVLNRQKRRMERQTGLYSKETEMLCVAAIEALGEIGVPGSLEILSVALKYGKSAEIPVAAAQALGNIQEKEAPLALMEVLPKAGLKLCEAILEALEKMKAQKVSVYVTLSKSKDWEIRLLAVKKMGIFKKKEFTRALMARLSDSQREIVIEATRALGNLKAKEAEQMLKVKLNDKDDLVSQEAREALLKIIGE